MKKWRKRLRCNQFEAAELLGVHRTAFQNWEQEVRPIPKYIELACKEVEWRSRQRSDFGPVLVVQVPAKVVEGNSLAVSIELVANNSSAIELARKKLPISSDKVLIRSLDGTVIWDALEIAKRCS
ncbi:XRE family transcriptional regulator [Bradyrhizobium canariense]|uniref:XRE family transcriptional regulator n=1 Tax=Bradyrhizobium canariense TaxID=255045 RepID=UPI001177F45F|nr:XRE family transcriptional regulator [Bradyrhizobium canariense]